MDEGRLKNKVAIVTGGGSGIGEAICIEFAAHGAAIAVADIDQKKAEAVAEKIRKSGGQASPFEVNVSDAKLVALTVSRILEAFGTVDILANCAGINQFKPVYEFSTEEWETIRSVNLDGPWHFSRAVMSIMMEKKCGKIINIASTAGLRATPHASPYSTAKHGLIGLTRTMAVDLGSFGINVNCICPASVESPLLQKSTSQAYRQKMKDRLPLGRLGRADDIAKAALFLASDDASWITGVILPVDGGLTCCNYAKHEP
jgi:NAD(P)-dependent dehydrogenase (short-subunit alcohol dehydrogenase family)